MIVYCHCAFSDVTPKEVRAEVLRQLCEVGADFQAVPDLCELAARRDPALRRIAESGNARIAACYPRAVRWLFSYAGAPLPEEGVEILNMRTGSADAIVESLLGERQTHAADARSAEAVQESLEAREPGQWIPWFPVIDYGRCKSCEQCFNFCLFGVYALSGDGRVEVRNPANCKTNCPACARICPNVAIIFPKHKGAPINGDEVSEADARREKVKIDPSSLVGGDVYAALRQRSQRARERFSKDRDEERAGQQQKICACMTAELQKQLGIPPEVLQSLSIDDIQARLRAVKSGPNDGKANGGCE